MYKTEQLINPTADDIAQILNLFRNINGRTCTAADYLKYLNVNWGNIALFIAKDEAGNIVSFTQAESPSILDPKCAWLPFSYSDSKFGHKRALEAVKMAENWMRERGATKWKMNTVLSPSAINRLWGLKQSDEIIMEKIIQ